jgi:hypothetical protein
LPSCWGQRRPRLLLLQGLLLLLLLLGLCPALLRLCQA